jgi:hypothetical protein
MIVGSIMTVSWAWIATWVGLGAVCTVLGCIVLAMLTGPRRASRRISRHQAERTREQAGPAHEELTPAESEPPVMRRAA